MTLYLSNRDGNGKTSEEGHYKLPVNTIKGNILAAGDFLVTQLPTPAMGVRVAAGIYRIPDVSGNFSYTGWSSDFENITVPTSDGANPRISCIVLYVDKSAATSASPPNNPGITKLAIVNGTPATVPVAPTNTQIQAIIGATNPYITLATVRTNAAASSIVNANITDLRNRIGIADDVLSSSSIGPVIGNILYPIGSIYMNKVNATNPATLLGFGTWVAITGRVVVGKAASGTFATAGATGGAETHTLTIAEMPAHNHTMGRYGYTGTGANGDAWNFQNLRQEGYSPGMNNTGGGGAHNNLQPYVVAYMWERTA